MNIKTRLCIFKMLWYCIFCFPCTPAGHVYSWCFFLVCLFVYTQKCSSTLKSFPQKGFWGAEAFNQGKRELYLNALVPYKCPTHCAVHCFGKFMRTLVKGYEFLPNTGQNNPQKNPHKNHNLFSHIILFPRHSYYEIPTLHFLLFHLALIRFLCVWFFINSKMERHEVYLVLASSLVRGKAFWATAHPGNAIARIYGTWKLCLSSIPTRMKN